MLISFFEEFPTKKNLDKIKLINFPTKLYLASPSLKEFQKLKSKIRNNTNNKNNIKEIIYWPILDKKEGYWISPFSKRSALKSIFDELKNKDVSVMLDLELPTTRNRWLYLTQFLHFCHNKKRIKKFIKNHPGEVYLAEYYPLNKKYLDFLGLHYKNERVKVIKMLYHSMHHFSDDFLRQQLKAGKERFGNNYLIGYGTIAKGITKSEPILSDNVLKKDLKTALEMKIDEVVIFRLGGLNQHYLKAVEKMSR